MLKLERPEITGQAALAYIPRSRGGPHQEDSLSRAILQFHTKPQLDWANLYSRLLQGAIPIGADTLTFPPHLGDWSAGRTLADALSRLAGMPCRELLFFTEPHRKAPITCTTDLQGRRICVVDDIWRTGNSLAKSADALKAAGASYVSCLTLAKVVTRADQATHQPDSGGVALVNLRQGVDGRTKQEFVRLVSDIPTVIEAHRWPIFQQLARVISAVSAYAQWSMENIDVGESLYGDQRFGDKEAYQGFADALMEALRQAPMAKAPTKQDEEMPVHDELILLDDDEESA